jgi:quercetin dioxygenase-like cupin family protein
MTAKQNCFGGDSRLLPVALLWAVGLVAGSKTAYAQAPTVAGVTRKQLLQQSLPPTQVTSVLMNEITLAPGQASPDHHHPGEVYGYVLEGEIKYQVAGQPPQLLRAGESFREAAGQRVLAFNNNSPARPCRFVAFYLLQANQPPVVLTAPASERSVK